MLIDEQIQEIGDELSEGVACGSFAASVGGICPPRSVGGRKEKPPRPTRAAASGLRGCLGGFRTKDPKPARGGACGASAAGMDLSEDEEEDEEAEEKWEYRDLKPSSRFLELTAEESAAEVSAERPGELAADIEE